MPAPLNTSTYVPLPPSRTTPVANPTWYGDIRYMFTQQDTAHMGNQGLDLTSYDAVVASAGTIYSQTAAGHMPPGSPWPAAWTQTFLNWMVSSFVKGTNSPSPSLAARTLASAAALTATRIRKDIETLSAVELTTLAKAFAGIMAKDPSDPNSYFVQAGYHWLPAPLNCLHHVPGYNPWHRAYLMSFENALRSVPGCENVTLPYWDIKAPFPTVLKGAPFDTYTLPQDIGGGFSSGYATTRYPYDTIATNLAAFGISEAVDRALAKTTFEEFHGLIDGTSHDTIILAHDGGHVAIGPTMKDQAVAAFDPVFWFFHCNWDRLFWQWQQGMNATTLAGLLTTIAGPNSKSIFTVPVLQALDPFSTGPLGLKTIDVVDSAGSLDVDYEHPAVQMMARVPGAMRSAAASRAVRVATDEVNVRVEGINRLKIPGSFVVRLLSGTQVIASRAFFQPVEADKCEKCTENAVVHFDFKLPIGTIGSGKLSIRVEPTDTSFVGASFPHKLMGNPTIAAHLLLHHE